MLNGFIFKAKFKRQKHIIYKYLEDHVFFMIEILLNKKNKKKVGTYLHHLN